MVNCHRVPPAPQVIAQLFAEYLREGRPLGLTFKQFLALKGLVDASVDRPGMDDGKHVAPSPARHAPGGPELISVPSRRIVGTLRVKVLLVDFSDQQGGRAAADFAQMLFTKGSYPTGSLRDFYREVSLGRVDVDGSVHGWLRMPKPYSYYTNGQSGCGGYPRNAQRMAEDAVAAALENGIVFEADLDKLGQGTVTALFVVHAGVGAETQADAAARNASIWSHKWMLEHPVSVGTNLSAAVYLTVPEDAAMGVCAHELGHLAFQWEDFYDPNYDEDGSEWDGAGRWDLMAGGSWNGDGRRPAHPCGLHKTQHGWLEVEELRASKSLSIDAYTAEAGRAVKIVSPVYRSGQYLLLENRAKRGFDSELPGEGLLVWRVDESKDMFKPDRPALLLIQADGRHDLERVDDWNDGDAGDPFPGSARRASLDDQGDISTSFPGSDRSGVSLANIQRDPSTGRVTVDVAFAGGGPPPPPATGNRVVTGSASPQLAIGDNDPVGVTSDIVLEGAGLAQEIAVSVKIAHTYVGDLKVDLVAPTGARVTLHNRAGGSADNLDKVYRSTELAALAGLVGTPVAGRWLLEVRDLAAADVGTLQEWGLAIALDPSDVTEVRERRALNRAIPDADVTGISDVVTVARAGVARAVSVDIDIVHTYIGDLRVELVAPSGARALLHNRTGGATADLKRTFTSADTAELAALVSQPIQGDWSLFVSDLAGRDVGTLREWTLVLGLGATPNSAAKEAKVAATIPDNTAAGLSSALTFEEVGTVQQLELVANIAHPYVGDLRVELIAPSGARAVLHDRKGGRARNLNLDLTSASSEALGAFVGQPLQGAWILRVADLAALDVGTFENWSLRVLFLGQ